MDDTLYYYKLIEVIMSSRDEFLKSIKKDVEEKLEYTGQISFYGSTVTAEILKKNPNNQNYDHLRNSWWKVADKQFGEFGFRKFPKQKSFDAAKKWLSESLESVSNNCTALVSEPAFIDNEVRLIEVQKEIDAVKHR